MIIEAIKNFISSYDGIDDLLAFYTDHTGNEPSYSIDPLPGKDEFTYVDGGKKIGLSFALTLVECIADEASRTANQDFFEGLSEWIDEQNAANNLPTLTGKYEALSIEVTTSGYLLNTDEADNFGDYQIQFKFYYYKEA